MPPAATPGAYTLTLTLVDNQAQPVSSPTNLGQVTIAGLPRSFTVPPMASALTATFGDSLKLWGFTYAGQGELTLAWSALKTPPGDYKFFVHLFDPADGTIVAQKDAQPRQNTYPTSLWLPDEVVTDTIRLDLSQVNPGDYRLGVGWYNAAGRLPARDANGQPVADDRVILPEIVHLP